MTTPVRATRPRDRLTAGSPTTRSTATPAGEVVCSPSGAGFVLYVGVGPAFGTGPQALRDLVEAAETLQELARDLLPTAETHTSLALTPPPAS